MSLFSVLPGDLQRLLLCHIDLFDFVVIRNIEPFSKFITTAEFWKYLFEKHFPSEFIENLAPVIYKPLYLRLWRPWYLNYNMCVDEDDYVDKIHVKRLNDIISVHSELLSDKSRNLIRTKLEYDAIPDLHTNTVKFFSLLSLPTHNVHTRRNYEITLSDLSSAIIYEEKQIIKYEREIDKIYKESRHLCSKYNIKLEYDCRKLVKTLNDNESPFPIAFKAYDIILNDDIPLPSVRVEGMSAIRSFLDVYGKINKISDNNDKEIFSYPDKISINQIIANHGTLLRIHNKSDCIFSMCWFDFRDAIIHCTRYDIPSFIAKIIDRDFVCRTYNVPNNWLFREEDNSSCSCCSCCYSTYSSSMSECSICDDQCRHRVVKNIRLDI